MALATVNIDKIVKVTSASSYVYTFTFTHSTYYTTSECVQVDTGARRTDASFVRETGDGRVMRIPAYFATPAVTVNEGQEYDIDTLHWSKVDQWNKRGLNFNMERVSRLVLSIYPYRPLRGSTFVRTPVFLANKHCLINVQNNDEKCFIWSVLSALYPAAHNPQRLSKYKCLRTLSQSRGVEFSRSNKTNSLFRKTQPLHIRQRFGFRRE